jgi:hypothetical protein
MRSFLAAFMTAFLPLPLLAQAKPGQTPPAPQTGTPVAPGTPVNISVSTAPTTPPAVVISLGARQAGVMPQRLGFTHTGGGNIDVAQPSPDVVVITMTGVVVAGPHPIKDSRASMCFELSQAFEISFDAATVKKAKMTMEGRVLGLLRSHCKGAGSAEFSNACGSVGVTGGSILSVCVPPASATGGQNVSLNVSEGPQSAPVVAGNYALHQTFTITAQHPRGVCPTAKAASAEFAPDPALDPLWISFWEPFHGAAKKDFGFQLTIKVMEDTADTATPANGAKSDRKGK